MTDYRNRHRKFINAIAIGIVCLFSINTVSFARVLKVKDISKTTLSPEVQLTQDIFKEKFQTMSFLLVHPAVNKYIKEQIEKEQSILKERWIKERVEKIDVNNNPGIRGNITYNVEGFDSIIIVKVAGLLAHTGQFAHVGLGGKDYDGVTVAYVDSVFYNKADNALIRHEVDEALQWERLRANILGLQTKQEMRDWIKSNIDEFGEYVREQLKNTPYANCTNSREIAKVIHEASFDITELYELVDFDKEFDYMSDPHHTELETPKTFAYDYIIDMFTLYGLAGTAGDVNIAAQNLANEDAISIIKNKIIDIVRTLALTGEANIRPFIELVRQTYPHFNPNIPEDEWTAIKPEMFIALNSALKYQLFMPNNEVYEVIQISDAPEILRAKMDAEAWQEQEYLKSKLWINETLSSVNGYSITGMSPGWFALIDSDHYRETGKKRYQDLMKAQFTPGGAYISPYEPIMLMLMQQAQVKEEDFVEGIVLEHARQEEIQHAKDNAYVAQKIGRDNRMDFDETEQTVSEILKPTSTMQQQLFANLELQAQGDELITKLNRQVSYRTAVEYSGRLGGIIGEMKKHLNANREDLAFIAFLHFMEDQFLHSTPQQIPHGDVIALAYINVAVLMFQDIDEWCGTPLDYTSIDVIRMLGMDPGKLPVSKALRMLEEIYAKHFWTDEERLGRLPEGVFDLSGPLQEGDPAEVKDAAGVADRTAQDADIDIAVSLWGNILPAGEKPGLYYEIRYDSERLGDHQNENETTAASVIRTYVDLMKMWTDDPDRVQLIKNPSRSGAEKPLITVKCFTDPSRSENSLVGEGQVTIKGDIKGQSLRIIAMLNMALSAANIPRDADISDYPDLISFIKSQYKEITGSELEAEDLLKAIRYIELPKAEPVPVNDLDEYYRLTIRKMMQSA